MTSHEKLINYYVRTLTCAALTAARLSLRFPIQDTYSKKNNITKIISTAQWTNPLSMQYQEFSCSRKYHFSVDISTIITCKRPPNIYKWIKSWQTQTRNGDCMERSLFCSDSHNDCFTVSSCEKKKEKKKTAIIKVNKASPHHFSF